MRILSATVISGGSRRARLGTVRGELEGIGQIVQCDRKTKDGRQYLVAASDVENGDQRDHLRRTGSHYILRTGRELPYPFSLSAESEADNGHSVFYRL
jgi:hypothetical protein